MAPKEMDQPVPVTFNIEALYAPEALVAERQRWGQLLQRFSDLYGGKAPEFIARSPGRVNLIGEHIDYSLYEVLPMAIAADVIIAVSVRQKLGDSDKARISIANVNPSKFKTNEFTFSGEDDIEIDASTHEWTNYFKSGLKGAISLLKKKDPHLGHKSMQIVVDGTVPAGGGLSSSAAFVCASALAVLRANGVREVIKSELVELAIVSERSVGVNSGGMDQAASVFSVRGDAVSVSFSPSLHAEAIAFPKTNPPITFMIAQSFVAADKHVTAPECYNLRVVECTLAAEYLAAKLSLRLPADSGPLGASLRGLQNAYYARPGRHNRHDEDEKLRTMLSLVKEYLPSTSGLTREEIATVLGTSIHDLEERYMTKFPVRAERFYLRQRAEHVFTEALRVSQFKTLLLHPPPGTESNPEKLFQSLGTLMNETQTSCRDLYDCSCPELDELCTIARRAGAYGSRLTGAGWGGCSVHLVPKAKVEGIKKAWIDEYYSKKFPGKEDEGIVVSEPGHGSFIIEGGGFVGKEEGQQVDTSLMEGVERMEGAQMQ